MNLIQLRHELRTGKRMYRKAWPAYAGWSYSPTEPLTFIDRTTHHWFWTHVMQDAVMPGVPAGLKAEDVRADDWVML